MRVARNLAVMVVGALVASACSATKQVPVDRAEISRGFLGSGYARLQPGAQGEAGLRWVNPDARWSAYDAVMIDPVTFWTGDGTQLTPLQQQAMCNYLYDALKTEFGKKFRIVSGPGAGVMRIQVALTDASAATPGLRTISTVVPQLHVLNSAQSLVSGKLLFVGGAQVEGKVTDSLTGQILAEAVDREVGGGNIETALQWKWGDAENAMDLWAKTAADRIAAWHGGASTS